MNEFQTIVGERLLDERLDPNSNPRLLGILEEVGITKQDFEDSDLSGFRPWGRYFNSSVTGKLVLALNSGMGNGVHRHRGPIGGDHKGGIVTYIGCVVDSDGDLTETLEYTCQPNRIPERVEVSTKINDRTKESQYPSSVIFMGRNSSSLSGT